MIKIKNKLITFLLLIVFMASASNAAALMADITVKPSFSLDEKVFFDYVLISDANESITYVPSVNCPNAPIAMPQQKEAMVEKDKPYRKRHYDITIDSLIEPQTCTANLEILSHIKIRKQKNFEINASPSFVFEILTCKDESCKEKSKTFVRNTDIYFSYDSAVKNPTITAKLIYPDKTEQIITLPMTLTTRRIGTYTLEATASKKNYKTITKKELFAVIEKEADIEFTAKEEKPVSFYLIILMAFVFILIIISVIWIHKKIKKPGTGQGLNNYIRKELSKCFSKKEIKNALIKRGWKGEVVDKAFERIKNE